MQSWWRAHLMPRLRRPTPNSHCRDRHGRPVLLHGLHDRRALRALRGYHSPSWHRLCRHGLGPHHRGYYCRRLRHLEGSIEGVLPLQASL